MPSDTWLDSKISHYVLALTISKHKAERGGELTYPLFLAFWTSLTEHEEQCRDDPCFES